jgi:hypothetical protein
VVSHALEIEPALVCAELVRVSARRAALLGLDAPARVLAEVRDPPKQISFVEVVRVVREGEVAEDDRRPDGGAPVNGAATQPAAAPEPPPAPGVPPWTPPGPPPPPPIDTRPRGGNGQGGGSFGGCSWGT